MQTSMCTDRKYCLFEAIAGFEDAAAAAFATISQEVHSDSLRCDLVSRSESTCGRYQD